MSELVRIDPAAPGAENMRTDESLLDRCVRGELLRVVRLYAFRPACLSLGRMQSDCDVDVDACRRDGVDVVRRPSGGRAVLHDRDVTYAVVCRTDDPDLGGAVLASCARIHAVVAAGLASMGVATIAHAQTSGAPGRIEETAEVGDCFSRPSAHELLDAQRRKLVGSAQARRAGALLQHGSVLLEPHRAAAYIRTPQAQRRSASVGQILRRDVTFDEVAVALRHAFERVLGPRALV